MPVSSIHSGHVILQQSRTMARQATEELNEEARLEKARTEKMADDERIQEIQADEEIRASERTEDTREADAVRDTKSDYQESFNRLPSAEEERDTKLKAITNERRDESDYIEAAVKLNQAKSYNSVGASVVSRSNDMIGSMLDISV
ncbi:hypothetical protein HC752_17400 [Vibrio sp. S9_S30]|uniref:hypothetical protein n=1 Tax=Vibrio sp. S9_S30 TaxID=2720226 RepID=UPI001681420E|nr:hypothetical protein [Vibrio sp. S9_S30]MBD1558710.1 hypothetical protein [Vibrio sp. S9_S30]